MLTWHLNYSGAVITLITVYARSCWLVTGSSLLVLHEDFLMAEFKFMQVKITFDDKLKVVELAGANKRRS